jgi:hypothetical protein
MARRSRAAVKRNPINTTPKQRKTPGSHWRVLAHARGGNGKKFEMEDQGVFDELVIDRWFHIEQMDNRVWWMRVGNSEVGDWVLWVTIGKDGRAKVMVEQDK